jgi:hypothetical protein
MMDKRRASISLDVKATNYGLSPAIKAKRIMHIIETGKIELDEEHAALFKKESGRRSLESFLSRPVFPNHSSELPANRSLEVEERPSVDERAVPALWLLLGVMYQGNEGSFYYSGKTYHITVLGNAEDYGLSIELSNIQGHQIYL